MRRSPDVSVAIIRAKNEEVQDGKETHTELVHRHQPRWVDRGPAGGQLGLPPLERGAAPSAGHANDRGVEDGGGGATGRGHGGRGSSAAVRGGEVKVRAGSKGAARVSGEDATGGVLYMRR